MIFDKIGLLGSKHQQTRIIPGMKWLVLGSYGIDGDSFGLHLLDVFGKILGIHAIIFGLQTSANETIVVFHPNWWRPRRGNYLDVGIDGQYFFQHWNHIIFIGSQAKFFQIQIGLSCW